MVVSSVARKKVWVLPIVLCIAGLMVLPASAVLAQHAGPSAPVSGAASTRVALGQAPPASALVPGLPGSASPTIPGLSGPHLPKLPGLPASGVHPTSPSNASHPSGSTPASASGLGLANLSADLARINATFAKVPGSAAVAETARLIAEGVVPAQDAYLPNLHLLSQPATSPVTPSYNVSPGPMGLADLGLGASGAYSVYTPGVLGALSLDGYNATAGSLYEDTGAYYWDGLSPNAEATPWQSGVQLNTVVTNISYPGSNTGVYWTQNVVDFSGDQLQFIDNVWNFTGPNASMNASTLYSYNGSWIVGDYYYDVGPVLPLAFPLTIDLYNNASNVGGRSTVTFGYRVTEGTSVYTGTYDTVVFNSMPTSGVPLLTPDFLIDGYQPVYTAGPYQGPLYDAELVFGGPGGGSNAVINSLSGSMNLDYLTGTSWSPAPSAYDYGGDTGETAIGFAGWWQGSTEYINQGPSILYGLWNTPGGVPSGETQIIWYNSPIYALDFWGPTGVAFDNLSYMPSEPNGTAQTWLPPSTTVGYTAEAFADGFDPVVGILSPSYFGAGATSSWYSFPISAPGFWDAPIYMDGSSQALAMATYATGWSSGPYVFANLAVSVDLAFNHLNDWGFPEFDLFWSYSAGNELVVSNISQGADSSGGLCSPGGAPATCYLSEAPLGYENLPGYGAEIADWNGSSDVFENLLLEGWDTPIGVEVGGVVSLWNTSDAVAYNISSVDGSFGVWAANSPYLEEVDSSASDAIALTLLDSPYALADTISTGWFGVDVLDEGGMDGDFLYLDAAVYSTAFEGLAANYSEVGYITADWFSTGLSLESTWGLEGAFMTVENNSTGVNGYDLTNLTVGFVSVTTDSEGVDLEVTFNTTLAYFYVNESQGGWLYDAYNPYVFDFEVTSDSLGLGIEWGSDLTADYITATDASLGLYLEDFGAANITDVVANDSLGVEVSSNYFTGPDQMVNVTGVDVTNSGTGVEGIFTSELDVYDVQASAGSLFDPSVGVDIVYSTYVQVTNASAIGFSEAVYVWDSDAVDATNVSATASAYGVVLLYSDFVTVTNVSASSGSLVFPTSAVYLDGTYFVEIANVSSSGFAWGVYAEDVYALEVTDVTAALGATGVFVLGSDDVVVTDVVAGTGSFPYATVGMTVNDSEYVYATNVSADGFAGGVNISWSGLVYVTNLAASNGALGARITNSSDIFVTNVVVTSGSTGVGIEDASYVYVDNVTATGATGTVALKSQFLWISNTTVTDVSVFGVILESCSYAWVTNTSAAGGAFGVAALDSVEVFVGNTQASGVGTVGVAFAETNDSWVNDTSATSWAVGVALLETVGDHVSHATANDPFLTSPWAYYSVIFLPTAAVVTLHTSDTTVSDVATDTYPLALYDDGSSNLFVQDLSAQHGAVGVMLNGTSYALLHGIAATWDGTGVQMNAGAYANIVTASDFENDTGYGVDIQSGSSNLVYSNDFAWDNGANGTYNATHVQAFSSSPTNEFNDSAGIGNYWADWHTYVSGVLAPYYISSGAWDYHPLGAPEGMVTVTFDATGLPFGTNWSVTLDHVAKWTVGASIVFDEYPGTYTFTVGAPSAWSASSSGGSVVVSTGPIDVPVSFSAIPPTYTVWINETGLASGTSWSAVFNGVQETTTGTSLSFTVTAGTYAYQIGTVVNYAASSSGGTATVGGNYAILVTYTSTVVPPPATYTVWINETGLTSGTSWSAVFNGVQETTTGTSLSFTVTAGTYDYQIGSVSGYTVSSTDGTAAVGGNYAILVTYSTPTVAPTTSSSVPTSTFNTDWAIALGLAALALIVALVALLRRPPTWAPPPAAAWQEPASQEGGTEGASPQESAR